MAVKAKQMFVIGVCPVCGKDVGTTDKDMAYRHGFDRFKTKIVKGERKFSQEDGRCCPGSGQIVMYRRFKDKI